MATPMSQIRRFTTLRNIGTGIQKK